MNFSEIICRSEDAHFYGEEKTNKDGDNYVSGWAEGSSNNILHRLGVNEPLPAVGYPP